MEGEGDRRTARGGGRSSWRGGAGAPSGAETETQPASRVSWSCSRSLRACSWEVI